MAHKFIIVAIFGALASLISALPAEYQHLYQEEIKENKHIPILKQNFEQHHGAYQHSFESANGIHVHEHGYFKNEGDKKHETLVQQGTITYHDEHGNPITLTYIADENGFQPQGDHLPTPPPIPEEIARALEQLPKHPEPIHEEPTYENHHY